MNHEFAFLQLTRPELLDIEAKEGQGPVVAGRRGES
jgi:hypothetical protein